MNCLLVSMDVNSLYTSIRHQDGIESVRSFLVQHTDFSPQQHKFCKDLLTLVLTRNFFIFEDQFFIQRKGTAMGSNVAPPYANIFMDHFESSHVYAHPGFASHVIYWRRYIDDVFLIWTGDVGSLLDFHNDLNSSVSGLTFSLSHDPVSMNFLDTKVIISANRTIETDLFVKSTDKNNLLKYDSCHPHYIKRAFPKSQHDRVDRIVSNPETSHTRHRDMDNKFKNRGYPDHVLTFRRTTAESITQAKTSSMQAGLEVRARTALRKRNLSAFSGFLRSPSDLTVCTRFSLTLSPGYTYVGTSAGIRITVNLMDKF
ncbi:unnamed protein product [Ranitomeya imitator]|uniref:Reverse transcriptase domain-containing protein n=1 Tax=Ranitomeya imitator TaxID=111125 RepID=A0ABN9MDW6_9NEOB|nr:unnamed protein product [Ranitomeya imitator]